MPFTAGWIFDKMASGCLLCFFFQPWSWLDGFCQPFFTESPHPRKDNSKSNKLEQKKFNWQNNKNKITNDQFFMTVSLNKMLNLKRMGSSPNF